jgi:hypothetical protein
MLVFSPLLTKQCNSALKFHTDEPLRLVEPNGGNGQRIREQRTSVHPKFDGSPQFVKNSGIESSGIYGVPPSDVCIGNELPCKRRIAETDYMRSFRWSV